MPIYFVCRSVLCSQAIFPAYRGTKFLAKVIFCKLPRQSTTLVEFCNLRFLKCYLAAPDIVKRKTR